MDTQRSLKALRADLRLAAEIDDLVERQLEVVGIVAQALEDLGIQPIVVGGLAVAYWTAGEYLSNDIDVVMPHTAAVAERMRGLGFDKDGRHWVLPDTDIVIEAPGSRVEDDGASSAVELDSGRRIALERVEDVLLLRLKEFMAQGHADVFAQMGMLRRAPALDPGYLDMRAKALALSSALKAVEDAIAEAESGREFELVDLHEIADTLREDPE